MQEPIQPVYKRFGYAFNIRQQNPGSRCVFRSTFSIVSLSVWDGKVSRISQGLNPYSRTLFQLLGNSKSKDVQNLNQWVQIHPFSGVPTHCIKTSSSIPLLWHDQSIHRLRNLPPIYTAHNLKADVKNMMTSAAAAAAVGGWMLDLGIIEQFMIVYEKIGCEGLNRIMEDDNVDDITCYNERGLYGLL